MEEKKLDDCLVFLCIGLNRRSINYKMKKLVKIV
jgi:hypothetical protein